MARNYAALPWEYLEEMDALEDGEFGRLARALIRYSKTGEPMALTGNERFYAKRVMAQEDRFQESYRKQSAVNAENGALGGRPRKSGRDGGKPGGGRGNRNKPEETEKNQTKPTGTQKTHTETETDTETNPPYGGIEANASCAEPPAASAPEPAPLARFRIPLLSGDFWPVTDDMITHWRELYPAVDVEQEILKMIGWCEANPVRRKTVRGIMRFINSWLAKEQDRGGHSAGNQRYTPPSRQSDSTWESLAREMEAKGEGL